MSKDMQMRAIEDTDGAKFQILKASENEDGSLNFMAIADGEKIRKRDSVIYIFKDIRITEDEHGGISISYEAETLVGPEANLSSQELEKGAADLLNLIWNKMLNDSEEFRNEPDLVPEVNT